MIFLILLLLFLTPCVSGTFVVNVTQTSYQAEENQNITLEWTFSSRTDTSLRSISTHCFLHTKDRTSVLLHLNEGVESPESQDPEFAGRVQWDKDVLTEGRLTLHVSRLRTNDSGFYVCAILVTADGSNSRRCWLNVTAATYWNKPETPNTGRNKPETPNTGRNKPETPNTGRRGRIGLYSASALVVLLALCGCVLLTFRRQAASEEGSDSGTGNSSAGGPTETV